MPISQRTLLDQYGEVVLANNASLFVGAGLSQAVGCPGWGDLLEPLRVEANIPEIADLPLLAQYYIATRPGGLEALRSHILEQLTAVPSGPSPGHGYISMLPVDDVWTTNYDCLLERAMNEVRVVASESDMIERRLPTRRRLTKMHGSLTPQTPVRWLAEPTITRTDYERYEHDHPRIWASLKSTYLTRTFLFLGFSFTDPNIEILLRLSRTLLNIGAPEHFTILKRPSASSPEQRLHDLRVADLEGSGIAVCEIDHYSELAPFLELLVRRTRDPVLLVSGSEGDDARAVIDLGKRLGHRLAEYQIEVVSLAGAAGLAVSFPFGHALRAAGRYDPARIRFYFRQKEGRPAPSLEDRVGTAVYTGVEREDTFGQVLNQSRAMVVLGGGSRTAEEVLRARGLQLPVVPLPNSGGTARQMFAERNPSDLLGNDLSDEMARAWCNLADTDSEIAASAATSLLRRAMYLNGFSQVSRTLQLWS